MAYDSKKPADDEYLSVFPAEMREQLRAIVEDALVNALKVRGYSPGNLEGNIPLNNGNLNANLNADQLDGHDATYFSADGHTHAAATQSANGFMTNTDKAKLDTIATGAEVNQNAFANISVDGNIIQADSKGDTLTLEAGANISLTPDATNDKVNIAVTGTVQNANSAANATNANNVYQGFNPQSGLYRFLLGNGTNACDEVSNFGGLHFDSAKGVIYSPNGYGWGGYGNTGLFAGDGDVGDPLKYQQANLKISSWYSTGFYDGCTGKGYTVGIDHRTGDIRSKGTIDADNDVYARNGWFRSCGDTGWYSEKYGGGWHMTDPDWIRALNGKGIYTSGAVMADGGFKGIADCANSLRTVNIDGSKNNSIFHWQGREGQPTWLWGGSDWGDMYVYNPSNFDVAKVGGYTAAQLLARNNISVLTGYMATSVGAQIPIPSGYTRGQCKFLASIKSSGGGDAHFIAYDSEGTITKCDKVQEINYMVVGIK